MAGPYTAQSLYAAPAIVEATPSAVPDHIASGHPEPRHQVAARTAGLGNPTVVLLVLTAVALALINVSFAGSIRVET